MAEKKKRERIQLAADYCSDILAEGWANTAAERVADYVTDATWNRLFASRSNYCKALARLAKRILTGKAKLHHWLGILVIRILFLFGVRPTVRIFAGELVSNVPIPLIDAKIIAVARGIQVTGILLCLVRDEDLTRCQCFIDLALVETKTQVRRILVTATGDWVGLADLPPKEWGRAA
jgi:hypothetical protein